MLKCGRRLRRLAQFAATSGVGFHCGVFSFRPTQKRHTNLLVRFPCSPPLARSRQMFSTRSKRTAGHPEVGRWRLSYICDRMPMRMVSVVLRRLCVVFDFLAVGLHDRLRCLSSCRRRRRRRRRRLFFDWLRIIIASRFFMCLWIRLVDSILQ